MYTGLVARTGKILASEPAAAGYRLRVQTDTSGLTADDSISVSGVCLTIEKTGNGWFEAYLSAETVSRTYLAELESGSLVNIEQPLSPGGQFDGHVVKGTVDTTTRLRAIERRGDSGERRLAFEIPDGYAQYLIEKGNVALDGVSLTVASLEKDTFEVAVVPQTAEITTLSELTPDDPVHFEADLFAKYAERRVEVSST